MACSGLTAFCMRFMVANVHDTISTAGYHTKRFTNLVMRVCCSAEGPTVDPPGAPPSMLIENLTRRWRRRRRMRRKIIEFGVAAGAEGR